jgi:aminopeptidase N
MIYTRAKVMYGQLRDVLGDSTFRAFLRRYYDDWALKHVDERAMRSAAELVSGRDLGWFFDQWVHATGLMDYAVD